MGKNAEGMAYYEEAYDRLEEPDYYMMDYYPYNTGQQDRDSQTLVYLKMGNVYDESRKYEFIGNIQAWLKRCIKKIKAKHPGKEIIFGFAPGHSPGSPDSFMITELNVQSLSTDPRFSVKPKLLQRHTAVPKQATGGHRSVEIHLDSIRVTRNLTGKIVCILDDVWTSGCTLTACSELVEQKGVEHVYVLAIGKTI